MGLKLSAIRLGYPFLTNKKHCFTKKQASLIVRCTSTDYNKPIPRKATVAETLLVLHSPWTPSTVHWAQLCTFHSTIIFKTTPCNFSPILPPKSARESCETIRGKVCWESGSLTDLPSFRVAQSLLVSTSSCRSVDDKGLLEGDAFTALQNYSTLNCAHLCTLCIMTQPHHTLISYQLTFWTPLLIGFTIDTYQNNYYLRWELRLVSLIEGIKVDGKD